MRKERKIVGLLLFLVSLALASCAAGIEYDTSPFEIPAGTVVLSFAVTADMREYTGPDMRYFRGACERLATGGPGEFMISPGDIDPPGAVYNDIRTYIGSDYVWYPVVGNHEAETPADMTWLRAFNPGGNSLPNVVKPGPANGVETSFSFDYGDVHFAVINEYYDGSSDTGTVGDVTDALHTWLAADLTANTRPIVFVIGHEPAFPQPDKESGRVRYIDASLNMFETNRDRFWQTLTDNSVTAYICGHTHNYSAVKINADGVIDGSGYNVWQIDVGHARGYADTGARSTFVMFYVMDDGSVWHTTYRLNLASHNYELTEKRQIP